MERGELGGNVPLGTFLDGASARPGCRNSSSQGWSSTFHVEHCAEPAKRRPTLFPLLGQGSHCGSAALHRQVKNVVVEWAGTCGRQLSGYDGCVSSGGAVPFVVERGGREMKRAYKSGATSAVDGVIHRTSLLAA